jgi:hypothetical protein
MRCINGFSIDLGDYTEIVQEFFSHPQHFVMRVRKDG